MSEKLRMSTRRQFGASSNRARLNRELVDAVSAAAKICDTCREIHADLETDPEGGNFVEAASFPGATIDKLDAHFRAHWKDAYELVTGSAART
ncbi:MAG TPA: hypothetical protein VF950_22460 [Planctomycetota bacterium]